MEKTLEKFGFIKNGLYSWVNEPYYVSIYFDGLTITYSDNDESKILYDGMVPETEKEEIEIIERYTKLKMNNKQILKVLESTRAERLFSNCSLNIANMLTNYLKFNNVTEEQVCEKLNIDLETLKLYLSGSYDFKLSEISKISILVGRTIHIK